MFNAASRYIFRVEPERFDNEAVSSAMDSLTSRMPIVGVPCYLHHSEDLLGGKGSALPESYVRALELAGCAPMMMPVTASPGVLDALYRRADGLLMAGGPDVAPAEYGQSSHPALRKVTQERDWMEFHLLRKALRDTKPLFCICRGVQILNVGCGGTLWQDLAAQVEGARKHDLHPDYPPPYLAHNVDIEPGSRLHGILGKTRIAVNSLHHQAIDSVGEGLTVSARSADGVIEAVEGAGPGWLIGVQWHPEWLADRDINARKLFDAFARACREHNHGNKGQTPGSLSRS